ncbi:hypothetical protein [uncultured Chitinophaga sp.]|uniref:LVIVD repeat-containing protein n=1 Tax=uncultured Chitinophaga sp. TaxID=339340 RepID=UPI0025F1E258|nr:hypothetical protein [uncultured Chitinophaga sp.]
MNAFYKSFLIPVIVVMGTAFQGCVKDTCKRELPATIYTAVRKSLTDVRADVRMVAATEVHHPGKIYIKGSYIFLNELNKGIHVFDNRNPAAPKQISFINIPGNVDLAVSGNALYADSFMDLVVFDITDPVNVKLNKRVENVYDVRYNYQFTQVRDSLIVDYLARDTVYQLDCSSIPTGGPVMYSDANSVTLQNASAKSNYSAVAKGGSMSRFTVMNSTLYLIDNAEIKAYNIQQPDNPQFANTTKVAFGIETLFPYKNYLFVGANAGMYIMDASNPTAPVLKGTFSHVRSCDPVVVEDDKAYVTLRSGSACQGFTNQLEVVDVKNVEAPFLIKTYPMKNPWGLGIDNGKLFICEGKFGLKFLDASNTTDIKTVKLLEGIETYDVIPYNDVLLVSAKDGLYQYSYTDLQKPKLLSKIPVTDVK